MKQIGLLLLFAACQFAGRAQYEDSLAQRVARNINNSNSTSLFNLFDSTFKTQFPLVEVQKAVPQLQHLLGEIKQVAYVTRKDHEFVYKLSGVKTPFYIVITGSSQQPQQLGSLLFAPDNPYFEIIKREKIATDNPLKSSLDDFVDSLVRAKLKASNTPGVSIGVLYNGNAYRYDYGETKLGNKQLPTPTTDYEIGSLTKTFTATIIARLAQEGKLNIDDPLNKYLPDSIPVLQYNGQPVLIRHVLSHTAGLPFMHERPSDAPAPDPNNPSQELQRVLSSLKHLQLQEKPGTQFSYSNTGFAVLGYVCEQLTGKPVQELYRQYIFDPLGMTHSFTNTERSLGTVSGHKADGTPIPPLVFEAYASAGGIRSTVDDLLRYLAAQWNAAGTPVNKNIQATHATTFDGQNDHLAYAWFWNKSTQGTTYFHSGATKGFTSKTFFNPQQKIAVVVLSNCYNADAEDISQGILDHLMKTKQTGS